MKGFFRRSLCFFLQGLSEDELVELGAMFAFFHFEGSWDNVHGWSFNDLR